MVDGDGNTDSLSGSLRVTVDKATPGLPLVLRPTAYTSGDVAGGV